MGIRPPRYRRVRFPCRRGSYCARCGMGTAVDGLPSAGLGDPRIGTAVVGRRPIGRPCASAHSPWWRQSCASFAAFIDRRARRRDRDPDLHGRDSADEGSITRAGRRRHSRRLRRSRLRRHRSRHATSPPSTPGNDLIVTIGPAVHRRCLDVERAPNAVTTSSTSPLVLGPTVTVSLRMGPRRGDSAAASSSRSTAARHPPPRPRRPNHLPPRPPPTPPTTTTTTDDGVHRPDRPRPRRRPAPPEPTSYHHDGTSLRTTTTST